MELKKFMKEVVDTLDKNRVKRASFQLSLTTEGEKVEVSPYNSIVNFKIGAKE